MYAYRYDNKYQLGGATYGSYSWATKVFTQGNARSMSSILYDAHGNLRSFTRIGADGVYAPATSDYLYTYTGSGNRLLMVEGGVNAQGQRPLIRNYAYDAIGRMTYEFNGSHKYYSYNSDHQITAVYSDAAKTKYLQAYTYDENGTLFSVFQYAADGISITKKTWYVDLDGSGAIVYTQDVASGGAILQEQIPLMAISREAVYYRQLNEIQYEITDHLGNVRATFKGGAGGTLVQLSSAEYDPYGNVFNATVSSPAYLHGYQGQFAIWDGTLKESRFLLRSYDPEIGRWKNPDPYDEFHSPYMAMGNNPHEVDPDGGLCCGPPPVKVGKGVRSTMNTYTVGTKIVSGVNIALTGTFKVLSKLDKFMEGDDGGAKWGNTIASFTPAKAIANTVSYAKQGTDTDGNKTTGTKVAVDLALELPIMKGLKYFKTGKTVVKTFKKLKFLKFSGDEAVKHFQKHADQIMAVTGKTSYNLKNYIDDANWILLNGTHSSKLNGYFYYIGQSSKGVALFGFVGLKENATKISTFHIKTAAQLGLK